MATLDDVRRYAMSLPQVEEGFTRNLPSWSVNGKVFLWNRAFSKADIKRFAPADPPSGDIIALVTVDQLDKEAILSAGTKGYFTIEHFNNFAGFLIQLNQVSKRDLKAAVIDAWLAKAPAKLAKEYLG